MIEALIAACAQLIVGAHIYTQHFEPSAGLNNNTPGLYVSCRDFVVGGYYNSMRHGSAYAGYIIRDFGGSPFDVLVGIVTGYERATVTPLVMPSFAWRGVRLSLIPPMKNYDVVGAVHLSYEVTFK